MWMGNYLLTDMHDYRIMMHLEKILEQKQMRITLIIDDSLIKKASILTGIKEKTSLVRFGLEMLIARESSKGLAKLGRTEENLRMIPRRRIGVGR